MFGCLYVASVLLKFGGEDLIPLCHFNNISNTVTQDLAGRVPHLKQVPWSVSTWLWVGIFRHDSNLICTWQLLFIICLKSKLQGRYLQLHVQHSFSVLLCVSKCPLYLMFVKFRVKINWGKRERKPVLARDDSARAKH